MTEKRTIWDRLFGRRAGRPETLLSEDEAQQLAKKALQPDGALYALVLRTVESVNGRVTWRFWTPTIGSGTTVDVDDATGETLVRHWGLR